MFDTRFTKENPISRLLKSFVAEEAIFQQKKPGLNMFIVVEGLVKIVYEIEGHQHLIGIAGPGEVLGEKAVLKDAKSYQRNFSCYAMTQVTLLEVTSQTLETVLTIWPDFFIRVLKLVEDRLAKANEHIVLLQYPNPVDRICEYFLYFQKHLCEKFPKNMTKVLTMDELIYAANVDRDTAENIVSTLVEKKILTGIKDGYMLSNEKNLRQLLPKIRETLAA